MAAAGGSTEAPAEELPELSPAVEEKLTALFNALDKDSSGELDDDEFVLLARAMGLKHITKAEARKQIRKADSDSNEQLDLAEWLSFSRVLMRMGEKSALKKVQKLTDKVIKLQSEQEGGLTS